MMSDKRLSLVVVVMVAMVMVANFFTPSLSRTLSVDVEHVPRRGDEMIIGKALKALLNMLLPVTDYRCGYSCPGAYDCEEGCTCVYDTSKYPIPMCVRNSEL